MDSLARGRTACRMCQREGRRSPCVCACARGWTGAPWPWLMSRTSWLVLYLPEGGDGNAHGGTIGCLCGRMMHEGHCTVGHTLGAVCAQGRMWECTREHNALACVSRCVFTRCGNAHVSCGNAHLSCGMHTHSHRNVSDSHHTCRSVHASGEQNKS
jgi:hypothetical protein